MVKKGPDRHKKPIIWGVCQAVLGNWYGSVSSTHVVGFLRLYFIENMNKNYTNTDGVEWGHLPDIERIEWFLEHLKKNSEVIDKSLDKINDNLSEKISNDLEKEEVNITLLKSIDKKLSDKNTTSSSDNKTNEVLIVALESMDRNIGKLIGKGIDENKYGVETIRDFLVCIILLMLSIGAVEIINLIHHW